MLLESQSKLVHENEIINNFIVGRSILTLKVISGKEITEAQHVGQVVSDFVSAGKINFCALGAVGITIRFLVRLRVRN